MSNTVTSIYMSMPVPVPTHQTGPQYATDLNSCLTILDSHTHSSGSGQQITPQGISINQDLPFYNNNATLIRSARFQAQQTPISQPTDLRCLYSSSADLYYNDSAGNQIRLTQNGGVAGTPGSIGGLLSPANLSYISGSQTYVFQSSTATAGNIDVGAITIREIVANSKGITIAPPAGLSNNFSLTLFNTLPTLSTKFLTVDTSGNIGDVYDVDNSTLQVSANSIGAKPLGITRPYLGPVGLKASSSCGNGTTIPSSQAIITNLSLNITTTGRPVILGVVSDGSANPARISVTTTNGTGQSAELYIYRNATKIMAQGVSVQCAAAGAPMTTYYPVSFFHPDSPASSSYTYTVQGFSNAPIATINSVILTAYEL